MKYKLRYLGPVHKQLLKKMDKHQALMIIEWLKRHVSNSENPRVHGKPLSANLSGLWRYRVGKYRIICHINDGVAIVLVIGVALRKHSYRGKTLLKIERRAKKYLK